MLIYLEHLLLHFHLTTKGYVNYLSPPSLPPKSDGGKDGGKEIKVVYFDLFANIFFISVYPQTIATTSPFQLQNKWNCLKFDITSCGI